MDKGKIEIQQPNMVALRMVHDGMSFMEMNHSNIYQDIQTGTEGSFKLSFDFSAREIAGADVSPLMKLRLLKWRKSGYRSADAKGWETFV